MATEGDAPGTSPGQASGVSKALSTIAIVLAAVALGAAFAVPGPVGPEGATGQTGPAGPQGPGGPTGADGRNCWDLNGNGLPDVATEDLNGDAAVDVLDCQAATATVAVGASGRNLFNGTNSTTFADVPGASVDVTVYRTSFFVITFSAEVWMNTTGDYIIGRALVDATPAQPGAPGLMGWITGTDVVTISCTYYLEGVAPGTHTVHIRWRTWQGTAMAEMDHWSLVVMAVPE
ncbi:MAG TPA: hypothetical protein VGR51_02930 [Thermoplasmata archaeon]|jgi:hypothetical protein|nr:hypothetical protein [Thermoplasmata archaeon]